MWTQIIIALGFILIILLCTEECRRLVAGTRNLVQAYPRLKLIAYPVLFLTGVAAAAVIIQALLRFIASVAFSYD